MLAFIVSSWDFSSRDLHKMGLFMGEEMQDQVDDIRFWCDLGSSKLLGHFKDAIKTFFYLAVTDCAPSSRTNPIIWWMAVLVQTQVLDHQPELPLGRPDRDFDSALTIDGKLQALNHYARVLVLESVIYIWKPSDQGCWGRSAIKKKLVADLDSQDMVWVDEDKERPPIRTSDELTLMATPAWQECLEHLRGLVEKWLSADSRGPMRELLSLLNGVVPARSYVEREEPESRVPPSPREGATPYEYKVMFQIWEDYTAGQGGYNMGLDGPASTGVYDAGTYTTLEKANRKARSPIVYEFGSKSEARLWDEHVREDGTVKIRAVFIDFANNSKAVAWVEKQATAAGTPERGREGS